VTTYSEGRYTSTGKSGSGFVICKDENLDRPVCIRWVLPASKGDAVQVRLAALQSVRSPYIALTYDVVESETAIGVVEEDLPGVVEITKDSRLARLHELCAGLAALHDSDLAHGAVEESSFRVGPLAPLAKGRLCNIAFGQPGLDDPSTDYPAVAKLFTTMGADAIADTIFQNLRTKLSDIAPIRALTRRNVVQQLRDRLAALLLHDKHRALAYWNGTSIELGAQRRSARLPHPTPGVASVTIEYDGTRFFAAGVSGEVFVNNIPLAPNADLPVSCVIALGAPGRSRHDRYLITFDQSHPEVT
jgi:eukaryotic-like serine/threonine-protein kinase